MEEFYRLIKVDGCYEDYDEFDSEEEAIDAAELAWEGGCGIYSDVIVKKTTVDYYGDEAEESYDIIWERHQ